jgi:hypothetical protein
MRQEQKQALVRALIELIDFRLWEDEPPGGDPDVKAPRRSDPAAGPLSPEGGYL